jgi:hypothetical protein
MLLVIQREWISEECTIGRLFVDGRFFGYTLEDVERDVKVKGMTAIPKGSYEIIISYSRKFKRLLPLVLNVPNFKGIRIHTGNSAMDTEGCILVGTNRSQDNRFVLNSKLAFEKLMNILEVKSKSEKIILTIK